MKRSAMICFVLLLVLALFTTTYAEGIWLEQVDVPVEEDVYASLGSETVDELSEVELPTPEADDDESTETTFSGESFAVEAASLDANDTDAGEQAVMSGDDSCKHDEDAVFVEYGCTVTNEKCTPVDKYHHYYTRTYRFKGQQKVDVVCHICDKTLYTSTVSGEVSIKTKELCGYMYSFYEGMKCSGCKQAPVKCEHKKYHKVNGGYKKYEYIDSKYHLTKTYTPVAEWGVDGYFVKCDTCGEMGWIRGEGSNKWSSWESGAEAFTYDALMMCKVSHDIEAHTFSNGVCSKCGLVKSGSAATATTVMLDAKEVTMGEKETFKLSATVLPSGKEKSLRYKSSNTKIAVVDAKTGKITAKKTGMATINAKIGSKTLATCKVTVKKAPNKVTLNRTKLTLEVGRSSRLKASITKGTHTAKLTWSSSNKKVAKVSDKGMVNAVGKGTATITVKTAGGVKATCKVTVKLPKKRLELSRFLGMTFAQVSEELGFEGSNGKINYGGSIGSNCVDIMEINSDPKNEYSLFGIYLGMKISEAENYLFSHGWKSNGYGAYELDDGTRYEYLEVYTDGYGTVTGLMTI